jgi:hypothetical protein
MRIIPATLSHFAVASLIFGVRVMRWAKVSRPSALGARFLFEALSAAAAADGAYRGGT